MVEDKYDKYFITEPVIKGDDVKKRLAFFGSQHFSGLNYWVRWNCFTKPRLFKDPPHAHDFDQVFHFMGGDPDDITDFRAVVEFTLEGEKYIFDRMTLIYVPKGMVHCPIEVTKVDKPIMFMNVALTGEYERAGEGPKTMNWK